MMDGLGWLIHNFIFMSCQHNDGYIDGGSTAHDLHGRSPIQVLTVVDLYDMVIITV